MYLFYCLNYNHELDSNQTQFVEYDINGSKILLNASTGLTYPPKIYLYKNKL
jgi:hypothetical protein